MKSVLSFLTLAFVHYLLFPSSALAHVKWFATSTVENHKPYQITDPLVIAWIIIAIVVVFVGIFLNSRLKIPAKLNKFFQQSTQISISIAGIIFGASLLIFSSQGFIFAPNLTNDSTIFNLLILLQTLSGLMILLGFFARIGGLITLVVFLLSLTVFDIIEMLDTLEIVGLAFFTILASRPKWQIIDPIQLKNPLQSFKKYSLPLLRILTGANLVILGFSEKIFSPSLTADFLNHYHWNFLLSLGITNYTNYWFAFSAGVVEILFGVFLILGLVTRLTTLTLSLVLITTMFILGPTEIVGHLPHFAIAIIFLINGQGAKLKTTK